MVYCASNGAADRVSALVFRSVNNVAAETPVPRVHSALMAAAAAVAAAIVGAATARKFPSRTTVTPLIASAAAVSALISVAPYAGARTTLAWSIPGRVMSDVYL